MAQGIDFEEIYTKKVPRRKPPFCCDKGLQAEHTVRDLLCAHSEENEDVDKDAEFQLTHGGQTRCLPKTLQTFSSQRARQQEDSTKR